MKSTILFVLMIFFIIPFYDSAWATTDLTTLVSPDVTISPSTGPPGTTITITVSNLPDISNEAYPYPDLYIYLPFSKPFGVAVSSHCGGEDCFPIYTHDDSLKKNFADRTISFSLFSKNNPNPIYLNGYENSVCDVIVNGNTVERFSTLCNTKEEPAGVYEIKLVWALETNLEQRNTAKTVHYTVTSGSTSSPSKVAETGDIVIKKYQNGTINGTEFVNELRAIGWNDEQIRQALAVIGKLPHQMGGAGPDDTQDVLQNINPKENETKTDSRSLENNTQLFEQIAIQTQIMGNFSEQANSSSISYQNNIPSVPHQDNSTWNFTIIGLSIALAAVVVSVVFILKKTQKGIHQT